MDDCRRFRKEPIAQKGLPASSQNATQSTWLIISFLEQNAQGDCCKFGHIRHRELKPPVPHLVVGDHLYRVRLSQGYLVDQLDITCRAFSHRDMQSVNRRTICFNLATVKSHLSTNISRQTQANWRSMKHHRFWWCVYIYILVIELAQYSPKLLHNRRLATFAPLAIEICGLFTKLAAIKNQLFSIMRWVLVPC